MKKMTMFKIRGRDCNRELTSLLILGTDLIVFRGLKTLSVLKDFKFGVEGKIETQLIITIKISNTFQGSLK